jgi:hypothetical protein
MVNTVERRQSEPAIPANISVYLTVKQERALVRLSHRGWHLVFIRRPLFREAKPVLMDKDDKLCTVLDSDGHASKPRCLVLRE